MNRFTPDMSKVPYRRGISVAAAGLAGVLALQGCGEAPAPPDRTSHSTPATPWCAPGILELNTVVINKADQQLLIRHNLPPGATGRFTRGTGHSQTEITDFLLLRQHGGNEADKPSWDQMRVLGQAIDREVQPGVPQHLSYGEGSFGNDDLSGGEVVIMAGIYEKCLQAPPPASATRKA